MASILGFVGSSVIFLYGLFSLGLYGFRAVSKGYFFRKTTEKETLELQIGK